MKGWKTKPLLWIGLGASGGIVGVLDTRTRAGDGDRHVIKAAVCVAAASVGPTVSLGGTGTELSLTLRGRGMVGCMGCTGYGAVVDADGIAGSSTTAFVLLAF